MAESPRIDELKRRVQSDPASIAFAALAEEYRRAGRFDEAIATCITGLQRHPSYLSAHVTLGRALIEVGRYDDAREELELVLRAAPENLAAIRGLAEIHHRRGETHDETAPYAPSPAKSPAPPAITVVTVAAPPSEVPTSTLPVVTQPVQPAVEPEPLDSAVALDSPPPIPAPDPVLVGLETFLAAIVRARDDATDARG